MAILKMKCPNTGAIMELKVADGIDVQNKKFVCPSCKERHFFRDCLNLMKTPNPVGKKQDGSNTEAGEKTRYGSNAEAGEKTQYSGGANTDEKTKVKDEEKTKVAEEPKKVVIGCLLDSNGKPYNLAEGNNTIGRKASQCNSSVKIETEDRYMSRNSHAVIDVSVNGQKVVHVIKNGANKNPSYVNDVLIGAADELVLNNGDVIKLGETKLTFKI